MINTTRINYIKVLDKLYEVEKISFYDFSVAARETDKKLGDVPEAEVFDISDFKEFRVKLHNWQGKVVDFTEFVRRKHPDLAV